MEPRTTRDNERAGIAWPAFSAFAVVAVVAVIVIGAEAKFPDDDPPPAAPRVVWVDREVTRVTTATAIPLPTLGPTPEPRPTPIPTMPAETKGAIHTG